MPPRKENIQAHRGASGLYPENTLLAFRKAVETGAGSIETDLRLLADGRLCLFHDRKLGRTVDGTRSIASLTTDDLRQINAGTRQKDRGGEPIPLLAEALAFQAETGIFINWEIKLDATLRMDATAEAHAVARALKEELKPPHIRLSLASSFDPGALRACLELIPDLPRALVAERLPKNWKSQVAALGLGALHLDQRALTRDDITAVKDHGLLVRAYTVNDPERGLDLLEMGVDTIITDHPEIFLK